MNDQLLCGQCQPIYSVSGHRMNHTGYISMVKTSISTGSCHFEIKITQTLVPISLDFLKTISDKTGT